MIEGDTRLLLKSHGVRSTVDHYGYTDDRLNPTYHRRGSSIAAAPTTYYCNNRQRKRTDALKWLYLITNAPMPFANSICNARASGRGTLLFQTPGAAKDLTHLSLGLAANAPRQGSI